MANRVEYIKIARIDQDGNNLTNTLEALTQITIPYTSGASPAVYPSIVTGKLLPSWSILAIFIYSTLFAIIF